MKRFLEEVELLKTFGVNLKLILRQRSSERKAL